MSGIIHKIKKLLDLADEGNGGTEGERDVAAAKAAKLMAEHRVTEADLAAAGEPQKGRGVIERTVLIYPHGLSHEWQRQLVSALAETVDCEVLRHDEHSRSTGTRRYRVSVIGRETSVDYIELMYSWIRPQLVRALMLSMDSEASKWARHGVPAPAARLTEFRASFARGAIFTIWTRLRNAEGADVGTEIVLSDREAVNNFVRSAYGDNIEKITVDHTDNPAAELLGEIAGVDIDITPGNKVAGASASGQLGGGTWL